MKNSIEEDIKNAEHFIKSIKTDKEYKEENGWHGYYNKEIVELARMLDHILSDYKRVLKINEVLLKENELLRKDIEGWKKYCEEITEEQTEMSNKNYELEFEVEKLQKENELAKKQVEYDKTHIFTPQTIKLNYIPIQKVKDKIEELDIAISECEYSDDDDEEYKEAVEKDKLCLLNQKRALQELIEEREEK